MLLLPHLIIHYSIRSSASSRQFFADLKKLYRATTAKVSMARKEDSLQRKCFVFDKDEQTKILIQMVYDLPSSSIRRKFNLLRSVDDSLAQTIRRLQSNIEQVTKKQTKKKKKQEKDALVSENHQESSLLVQLLDEEKRPIDLNLSNKIAWKLAKQLIINQQIYQIEYNAPAIIKFRFPEVILTNTLTIALVDLDYGEWKSSIFNWYVADELPTDPIEENDDVMEDPHWTHVHRGPFCVFNDEHQNKFVRLICLPRNADLREGMPGEHRSKTRISPCPKDLPMNTRHQLTKDRFPIDSNSLRVVSYNLLANGYASSADAGETLFSHCPPAFLDHNYRKPLLIRETLGYNADILAFQECDTTFYERELTLVLNAHGYQGEMKIKSENVREGEAMFYRTDRFSLINTHDITIKDYFRDAEHLEDFRRRFSIASEIYNDLLERNTVLQVVALRPLLKSNEVLLVCNTHLYFHYAADILRCLQSVVACERIREVKEFYEKQNHTVSIVWCGDFNANVTSLAFHLIFTGTFLSDPEHRSFNNDYANIIRDFPYKTQLEFSTYSNYAYTNFAPRFHGVIDHIFFDSKRFEFERAIPMPTHEEVTEFIALPSCKIPSDHLAVVVELKAVR